jgi:hypothetical protein
VPSPVANSERPKPEWLLIRAMRWLKMSWLMFLTHVGNRYWLTYRPPMGPELGKRRLGIRHT